MKLTDEQMDTLRYRYENCIALRLAAERAHEEAKSFDRERTASDLAVAIAQEESQRAIYLFHIQQHEMDAVFPPGSRLPFDSHDLALHEMSEAGDESVPREPDRVTKRGALGAHIEHIDQLCEEIADLVDAGQALLDVVEDDLHTTEAKRQMQKAIERATK